MGLGLGWSSATVLSAGGRGSHLASVRVRVRARVGVRASVRVRAGARV